jgi:hypothetical protein
LQYFELTCGERVAESAATCTSHAIACPEHADILPSGKPAWDFWAGLHMARIL